MFEWSPIEQAEEEDRIQRAKEAVLRVLQQRQPVSLSSVLSSTDGEGVLQMDAQDAVTRLVSVGAVQSDVHFMLTIPPNGAQTPTA